jgi:small-conductance mechanosensitive channel
MKPNKISDLLHLLSSKLDDLPFSILMVLAAIGFGLLLHGIITFLLKRWHLRKGLTLIDAKLPVHYLKNPLRALIPALCLVLVLPLLRIPEHIDALIKHLLVLWVIASIAWLSIKIVSMIRDLVLSHYHLDVKDNLEARRMYTQIRVVERVFTVVILLIAFSAMLMTFHKVRQVGVSLLASAGVLGIILGLAAQRTLGNLIAGIQIAIAQPIRLDDVVIVENEWGWIEEITLTYVVIRIWDLRRLIVPIAYFVEKPFQNWTRISANLLGTVFIYADYTIPVQEIREEFQRILESTDLWDKKASVLQVTDASKEVIEMRALMSAEDSPTAWNLRCLVREKLIEFMQRRFPESLPRVRVELEKDRSISSDTVPG